MNLEVHEAGFTYKGGFTLQPITHTFFWGAFSVLLGPNGSGKSTLFSLLNGIEKPDTGRVIAGGKEIHNYHPRQRAKLVGLIPQINDRPFAYTVEQMIRMGRFPHQGFFARESSEDRKIISDTMERLDLLPLGSRSVQELSGGEYQRVLVARVLVQQPSILLLDEPGNHLDLKHQLLLLSILREEADSGKTVVAVLHDINQALLYGDWGLLMKDGKCVRTGKPRELLTPANLKEVFHVELAEYRSEDHKTVLLGPKVKS